MQVKTPEHCFRKPVFVHHHELVQNDLIVRDIVLSGMQSRDPCLRNQGSHTTKKRF